MNSQTEKGLPLISIVVPVFNVERYLDKCIQSALGQTYENIELLLIDDGSTDASPSICDYYHERDYRVRVFHQENGGVSKARNYGITNAKGELFFFLDSDDWIESTCLSRLYELMQRYKTLIAQCGESALPQEERFMTAVEYLESKYYRSMVWGKLYDATLWKNMSFPIGKTSEDFAVVYKTVYWAKRIAVTTDELYHCVLHSDSITKTTDRCKLRSDRIEFEKEAISFFQIQKEIKLENWARRAYAFDILNQYTEFKNISKNDEDIKKLATSYREILPLLLKDSLLRPQTKLVLWLCKYNMRIWNVFVKGE